MNAQKAAQLSGSTCRAQSELLTLVELADGQKCLRITTKKSEAKAAKRALSQTF